MPVPTVTLSVLVLPEAREELRRLALVTSWSQEASNPRAQVRRQATGRRADRLFGGTDRRSAPVTARSPSIPFRLTVPEMQGKA